MFTAYGIALLIDQKKIKREDTLTKYIPEFPNYGNKITIHHLVHNLSGIKEYEPSLALIGYSVENYDRLSHSRILRAILNHKSTYFEPGSNYRYSNSGYVLLAEIISRVSGFSFKEWMFQNVFEPLEMNDTYIFNGNLDVQKNVASSYKKNDGYDDIVTLVNNFKKQPKNLEAIGAAHVTSSLRDMVKWVKNYKTGSLGGKSVLKIVNEGILPEEQNWDWYYGFQRYKFKDTEIKTSEGLTQGYRTYTSWLPEQNHGIIYLANDGEWRTYYIARKILDLFLTENLKREDVVSQYSLVNDEFTATEVNDNFERTTKTDDELIKLIGVYYSEDVNMVFKIEQKKGLLNLISPNFGTVPLVYKNADVFSSKLWFANKLEFEFDDLNAVKGLKLYNTRDEDFFWFKKR